MKSRAAAILLAFTALSPCVNAAEAVFANGMEVARMNSGVMIAFPDVSRTPERDRRLPGVPIPYPNSGMASDTDAGGITGPDIVLRGTRYARERVEEARDTPPSRDARPGQAYFEQYSFDVQFEGAAAVRHLDLMTHNDRFNPPAE